VQNSKCNGSYEYTNTINSSIEVIDNTFVYEVPSIVDGEEFLINGTFTSVNTAEIEVSWFQYDSYCDAMYDCSGTFYANQGASSQPPNSPYEIYFFYLQYRNYPNPAKNGYASFIDINKNSEPVQETDVVSFQITDSTGNVVTPTDSGFYRSTPYYFYNCITSPYTKQSDVIDRGFYANFNYLAAGAYRITVETTESPLITKPYSNPSYTFPNQSTLPIITQNRIQNLPIPSLPVVNFCLHLH
jgi:hypothetical protein